jgi:aminoglycoside phosphotransferase (APT) family kinase protein
VEIEDKSARLLRTVAEELAERLLPELTSADARERAALAGLVLEHVAADIDVLAAVAEEWAPEFRKALEQALRILPPERFADRLPSWRRELAEIPIERGAGRQREVMALRGVGAALVRRAADLAADAAGGPEDAAIALALGRLGELDHRWLTRYDAARRQKRAPVPVGAAAAPVGAAAASSVPPPQLDAALVTRYLHRRFPQSPELAASAVVPIPGGRSKKTYFISLTASETLPAELVMRQDYALRYEGTKVRDEYAPLLKLAALGLAVPRPLLLEPRATDLGPPFMFVERLRGTTPGSYFGMRTPCPGAFAQLARLLAKLHSLTPGELGISAASAPVDSLLQLIERYQATWRENATAASPLIDFAYAWTRRECAKVPGTVAFVHGDAGPYNLLIEADHLTGLLDWEFAHLGDPAVDLGLVRVYAEEFMRWDEFMRLYTAAGGAPVAERRVCVAMLVNFLKGAALVATSARNFEEGWTRDFLKGANSFTGQRLIELRIAGLLQRFGAV